MLFARTEAVRRGLMFCLCGSLALALGCGGGSNNSNSNTNVTPTQNTQPIAVNGGPPAAIALSGIYPNGAFTSVTVCVPGRGSQARSLRETSQCTLTTTTPPGWKDAVSIATSRVRQPTAWGRVSAATVRAALSALVTVRCNDAARAAA